MTISKDRVKPSPLPDSWKLKEIFATGVVFGSYLALMSVIFFWAMKDTDFFSVSILFSTGALTLILYCFLQGSYSIDMFYCHVQDKFKVRSLRHSEDEMMSALYLQVSIVSQALIFVTRSRGLFFVERPGLLLVFAFFVAQLVRFIFLVFLLPNICLSALDYLNFMGEKKNL